jgi:hypothetical protein
MLLLLLPLPLPLLALLRPLPLAPALLLPLLLVDEGGRLGHGLLEGQAEGAHDWMDGGALLHFLPLLAPSSLSLSSSLFLSAA